MENEDIKILNTIIEKFDNIKLCAPDSDPELQIAVLYNWKEICKELKYHSDKINNEKIWKKIDEIDLSINDIYSVYESYSDLKPALDDLKLYLKKPNITEVKNKKYFSKRISNEKIDIYTLHLQIVSLFNYYKDKDYFRQKLSINSSSAISKKSMNKCIMELGFDGLNIEEWSLELVTKNNIFDLLEYLYNNVTKPGPLVYMTDETGWSYQNYDYFSKSDGQYEFRQDVNKIILNFEDGFELNKDGEIIFLGDEGINLLFNANLPEFDLENIDKKVKNAISKWRNRNLDLSQRKEAIKDLADIFEWLKKSKKLSNVLNKKDESAIFEIANNFSIRHHNPEQIQNYDKSIWYSWIFHFYLATYHAVIRLIKQHEKEIAV